MKKLDKKRRKKTTAGEGLGLELQTSGRRRLTRKDEVRSFSFLWLDGSGNEARAEEKKARSKLKKRKEEKKQVESRQGKVCAFSSS